VDSHTRNDAREIEIDAIVDTVWRPWILGLLSVPFVAILGARLVTRFGNNSLILTVLTLLGLIAVAAYVGYLPERFFPLAIWTIAVSLLLHNSVLTHVLAWDAPKELALAANVIYNGVWDPNVIVRGESINKRDAPNRAAASDLCGTVGSQSSLGVQDRGSDPLFISTSRVLQVLSGRSESARRIHSCPAANVVLFVFHRSLVEQSDEWRAAVPLVD
jgi:hypothetical protein